MSYIERSPAMPSQSYERNLRKVFPKWCPSQQLQGITVTSQATEGKFLKLSIIKTEHTYRKDSIIFLFSIKNYISIVRRDFKKYAVKNVGKKYYTWDQVVNNNSLCDFSRFCD